MVPFALATAVSPLPLVVLLVVLLTPRAVPNGLAFAAGWATALMVLGAGTVVLIGGGAELDEGAVVSTLEVLVGLGLLLLALRQWTRRPRGADVPVPRWLVAADRFTARRAFAVGALLVVANPKNAALTVGAAGVVATSSTQTGDRIAALAVFAALGSAGLAVPLVLRIALGTRAVGVLTRWRRWLVAHGTAVACLLVALIGAVLVVRGVMP